MLISVDPSDPRPIYVQIIDEVRRALVVGTLSAEDPLPSVRQLAGELRVNPNTVSQAYRELERQGVVEVRRGQGTYVVQASVNSSQRRVLARDVAERALRDAHRNGLDVDELIHALRAATASQSRKRA
ncbi:MAG: Transcriptional regulator, GntR family [Gemmatimonadetes bacterium]|nr:Transcriptional regulator, GntR family [Gemmatimonadota bacterium]